MLPDPARIGFLPVAQSHLALLYSWMQRPHMRQWWGEPDEEIALIRDMVEGRDTTRPFLILLDGLPVGYIQYWFLGHYQNQEWTLENPWLVDVPAEAIGIDLSIGEPDLLSKGIGSAALSAFVKLLRGLGHEPIIIDPDPANLRAVRAYAKAGFRPVPTLEGRTEGVLIMQYDPKDNDPT